MKKPKIHKRFATHTIHSPVCDLTGYYPKEATVWAWAPVTCKKCLKKRKSD